MRRRFAIVLTACSLSALPASADPSPAYLVKHRSRTGRRGLYARRNRRVRGHRLLRSGAKETGSELWKSDGTGAGTLQVKDIAPGAVDSLPGLFTDVNGTLFFAADDGAGFDLWKGDGTEAGTVVVEEAPQSSPRGFLLAVAPRIVYSNADGSGDEPSVPLAAPWALAAMAALLLAGGRARR